MTERPRQVPESVSEGSWPSVALGSLARLRKGVSYQGRYLNQPGPLLLGLGTVVPGGGLNLDAARTYSGPVKPSQRLAPGDLFIALTDLTQDGRVLGSPARLPQAERRECIVTHHVARVELLDGESLDCRFLYYALQTQAFRNYVRGVATGTTVRAVSPRDAEQFALALPPLPKQHHIAEVLGALDDKIEANRHLTTHCDSAWRTLLETVTDGKVVPLAELADFVNGGAFTKGASGSGRMVVRIAELNSGPGGSTVYNDINVKPDQLTNPGDLLFAWSGSLGVFRWYRSESIINQHIFKVIPKPGVPMWLVHGRILDLMPTYRGIAADKATTMGHIQRRNLDEVVLVPGHDELMRLNPVCQGLWDRALAAERENLILADLRDTLLPELLSGRIRVWDIPKSDEEPVA
jgi:type I restriction enzyme S subunit